MPVDEWMRHDVYKGFDELLGPERAAAVMSLLPNVDWDQFATRTDLITLEQRLVTRMDALEQRLETRMDTLEQRLETRTDTLEQRLKARTDALDQRLETHMERTLRKAISTQTKWVVATVAALMLGMIGSTAALVQAILSRVPVLPAG